MLLYATLTGLPLLLILTFITGNLEALSNGKLFMYIIIIIRRGTLFMSLTHVLSYILLNELIKLKVNSKFIWISTTISVSLLIPL